MDFYRLLLRFYPPSSPWLMAGPPVRFFPDFYRSGDPVDVWIKTGYRIKSRGGFYPCGLLKCPYPAQQLESKLTNFLVLLHHTNLKAVPLIFRRLHKSLIPPIVQTMVYPINWTKQLILYKCIMVQLILYYFQLLAVVH